jgi:hypothetical protein
MKTLKSSLEMSLFVLYPAIVVAIVVISVL